ncbi:hypothetical protein CDD81_6336 [Ophiocordyceps australis]|uniref:Amino acid permease/ SLC12A domain-containing protein n=1 Tax=Ophiocordyceps australis TaxID=1399860 RepID=A0A2C5Y886_9HYPO|nr:hypothetical protein CDD81_6336 [Ophiocordyceps australis]
MSKMLTSSRVKAFRGLRGNGWERKGHRLLDAPDEALRSERDASQVISRDDELLATLGYKRELNRGLGLFENWAATFSCMNFVSGMPVLFGWVMMTGGPQAAITSWTVVSTVSCLLALAMAEIAAALPTAGGIYYWAYRLGGSEWGPFLSWMTAWWNWSAWILAVPGTQQGATNFLVSALQINYPDADFVSQSWFSLVVILLGLVIALIPNITNQSLLRIYFRFAIGIFLILFFLFWIWFPIAVAGRFQSPSFVFQTFHNGINHGPTQQASNAYCWAISFLFGAWEFGGYDASAHLAEETKDASKTVARGMYLSTLSTTLLSIPTLILILFCIQDFDALISATYANNWAEFLVQVVGPRGATAILLLSWIDCTCATAAVILSAQRVTFAISRDNILPGSHLFRRVSGNNAAPVNAALLVVAIAALVSLTVLGSSVAFSAITATTVICQSMSYLFVLFTRYTFGKTTFEPAAWNLGFLSRPIGYLSILWLTFLSCILLLPQVFPVTMRTLNYAPICLIIVTAVSFIGWLLPFGMGGRHWFKGPCNTVAAQPEET